MYTSELIAVFKDTCEMIDNDPSLREATQRARAATVLYKEGFRSEKVREKSAKAALKVVGDATFQCVRSLLNGKDKIAALNFANPYEPGGGVVRGARAQEECLCRCSNLYRCISAPEFFEDYYAYNKALNSYLFSDRVLYTPGVTVLKDDLTYERLSEPYTVDVITCAAPYKAINAVKGDVSLMRSVYEKRVSAVFEAAKEQDVDILVLGAFGCGAFYNDPKEMAEAFKRVIDRQYGKCFKQIVFAILTTYTGNPNFDVFSKVLEGKAET